MTRKQWIGAGIACLVCFLWGDASGVSARPAQTNPQPTPVVQTVTKTVPDPATQAKLAALTTIDNQLLLDASKMGNVMSNSLGMCSDIIQNPYQAAGDIPTINANNAQAQQLNADVSQLVAQRKQILAQ